MPAKIFLTLLLTVTIWAEPFVYSNSSSASSKQIKKNKSAIYRLDQETTRLREEIDGLRSIIEGLNRTINRLKNQKKSYNSKSLNDITILLNKIKQNYVSHTELKNVLKTQRVSVAKPKKSKTKNKSVKTVPSNRLDSASSSALYSKGVRLVGKKQYTNAKKRFDILSERGYKKASTHFYLGEIAYRTKNYTKAIEEYKQSALLDENTVYMDKLLLHSALAMEKNGEKAQAKRFFQAIIDGYPGTYSAKIAKKHL